MTIVPDLRDQLLRAAVRQTSKAQAGALRERRPGWARTRSRGVLLTTALVLSGSGAAAATGFVVSQATKDRADALTSEPALRQESPGSAARLGEEMVRAAAAIESTLPYPPGMQDNYDWSKYSAGATLGTGAETKREIQLQIEYRAGCLWQTYWLRAHDRGDRAAAADAVAVLKQVASWPATRTLPGGGEAAFAGAAARNEATVIRDNVARNCSNVESGEPVNR